MSLGGNKGHVNGPGLSGRHTTLIDGADDVVKKLSKSPWFESVRPGAITVAGGGKLSVTIRRHANTTYENTLRLIFRKPSTVQDVFLHVRDFDENRETILRDIQGVVEREMRGAILYDRTAEHIANEVREQVEETVKGSALLDRWRKRK